MFGFDSHPERDDSDLTPRERRALAHENNGNRDDTKAVIRGRGILAELRGEANKHGK
jgi:hypothetical protein